jgi:predicted SnoaL-like aldol condensation-catalyzing enzyme
VTDAELPDEIWAMRPDVDISVLPQEARGRLKGDYTVTARNNSPQPVVAYISVRGHGLRSELGPTPLQLAPGAQGWISMSVRSEDRPIFGAPTTRPFEVSCITASGLTRSSAHPGRFIQQALIPLWLLLTVAGIGLALGLVLAFALPDRTTVPDVTGAPSAVEAELILAESGLSIGNQFGRRPSDLQTGSVLSQVPPAGTEVDEGTDVSIVVALAETDTASEATIVLLPASFSTRCSPVAGAPALSTASTHCVNSNGLEIFAYQFASQTDLESSYAQRVAAAKATRGIGECGVDVPAEGSFATDDGVMRGRFLCALDAEGTPLIVWTIDGRLLQLEARWLRPASELAGWWRDEGRVLILDTQASRDAADVGAAPSEGDATQPVEPDQTPTLDDEATLPPAPGASDPASSSGLDGQDAEALGSNTDTALAFLNGLFNDGTPETALTLMGDVYFEHNPSWPVGPDALTDVSNDLNTAGETLIETHATVESGDAVAIHSSYQLNAFLEPDGGPGSVAVDIFRFDPAGRIIEHWGAIQDTVPPELTTSGRSMVSGSSNPTSDEGTTENSAVVQRLYDEVFPNSDTALLDELFADQYIDHNPQAIDGTNRLRSLVDAGPIEAQVARIVALGDLVFVHVHYPDEPLGDNGAVDIFRVDDGRITEHWDVFQPTVSATDSPSGNDMFSQLS